jgi:transcription elongation factor GreA
MDSTDVILTTTGQQMLTEELENLVNVRRPAVVEPIKVARELGDLKENAEYHDAKNEQAFIETKIRDIEAKLRQARIVDEVDASRVGIGTVVTTLDIESGTTDTWTITGSVEADPMANRISNESPIGRALMGCAAGDSVVVQLPRGEMRLTVQHIDVA